MLGAFVIGLTWLVLDMARHDSKGLRSMLTDSEEFAREAAGRPDFHQFSPVPVRRVFARVFAALLARWAERRP